jgi:hypothetical protein
MADFSVANDRKCAECAFSASWPYYQPPFLICKNPVVLLRTGGPRSCAAIGRAPGSVCGPGAALFKPKRTHAPPEEENAATGPKTTYTAP